MGKIQDTGKGTLTITYGGLESPIIGIDASKQSGTYINPQSLAKASSFYAIDGYLSTAFLNSKLVFPLGNLAYTPAYVIGDVQVFSVTQGANPTVTKASWGFIAVSFATQLIVYEFRGGFYTGVNIAIAINANQANTLTFYTVNGVVYITGLGFGAIYAYTPNPSGSSTLTLLTNYVGGAYLGELNGRLILLCCDQIVAGVYSYLPYYIYWSAPAGAYGIWNPLAGGLVTGAGFEQLPDVADEITGFFTTGPTGYVIRKQGITEMTPLNSGIEPFDFNHMWASGKGIGTVYPNTVRQYGSLGSFFSDTGIYTLGYGGLNEIEGTFWAQIGRQLDILFGGIGSSGFNYNLLAVTAALIPLYIGNERKLSYLLYIPTSDAILMIGDILTQQWNIVACFAQNQLLGASSKIQPISNAAFFDNGTDQSIVCVSGIFQAPITNIQAINLYTLDQFLTEPPLQVGIPAIDYTPSVSFPVEEVLMNRDITIDTIALYCDADTESLQTINIGLKINGVTYSSIAAIGQGQYYLSYPVSAMFTGKYPQLSLTAAMANLTSALRIYKIVMNCSYEVGQKP